MFKFLRRSKNKNKNDNDLQPEKNSKQILSSKNNEEPRRNYSSENHYSTPPMRHKELKNLESNEKYDSNYKSLPFDNSTYKTMHPHYTTEDFAQPDNKTKTSYPFEPMHDYQYKNDYKPETTRAYDNSYSKNSSKYSDEPKSKTMNSANTQNLNFNPNKSSLVNTRNRFECANSEEFINKHPSNKLSENYYEYLSDTHTDKTKHKKNLSNKEEYCNKNQQDTHRAENKRNIIGSRNGFVVESNSYNENNKINAGASNSIPILNLQPLTKLTSILKKSSKSNNNQQEEKANFSNNKNSTNYNEFNLNYNKSNPINDSSNEIKNLNTKKSVKFFNNPIDKSRDFFNDIMAKNRHRKSKNLNNNNTIIANNNNIQRSEDIFKQKLIEPLPKLKIMPNNKNFDSNNHQNLDNSDNDNSGYKITKSKHSKNVLKKLQSLNSEETIDEDEITTEDATSSIDCDDDSLAENLIGSIPKAQRKNSITSENASNTAFNFVNEEKFSSNSRRNSRDRFSSKERELYGSQTESFDDSPPPPTEDHKRKLKATKHSTTAATLEEKVAAANIDYQSDENTVQKKSSRESSSAADGKNNLNAKVRHAKRWGLLNPNTVIDDKLPRLNRLPDNTIPDKTKSSCQHQNITKNKNNNEINITKNAEINQIENLSELTECDRDSFIQDQHHHQNKHQNRVMGQTQNKDQTPSTTTNIPSFRTSNAKLNENSRKSTSPSHSPSPTRQHRSRSQSPPLSSKADSFDPNTASNFPKKNPSTEPIITEPISPQNSFDQLTSENDSTSDASKYQLPKITVADYSKKLQVSPDSEVYFEFENTNTNFNDFKQPTANITNNRNLRSSPVDIVGLEDIKEEDENEDDWHEISNEHNTDNLNNDYLYNATGTPDSGFNSMSLSSLASTTSSLKSESKILVINSCDLINDDNNCSGISKKKFLEEKTIINEPYFITDASNNDITNHNEIFTVYNENHYDNNNYYNDRNNILIDSISLPDVVVESTTNCNKNNKKIKNINFNNNSDNSNSVNKSKSTGNVHFIPMRVEATDDTIIGGKSLFNSIDIEEIIEEDNNNNDINNNNNNNNNNFNDNLDSCNDNKYSSTNKTNINKSNERITKLNRNIDDEDDDEIKKKDLINQEARLNIELEDAQKNAYNAQEKANELQYKIEDMEKELTTKSWNIERLQAELKAAYKEDECVRRRLKTLEEQKEDLKQKFVEEEDEFNQKYESLEAQYKELDEKYKKLRALASNLQTQLAKAQAESDALRLEKEKLAEEKDAQLIKLEENLEKSQIERKTLEKKWQKEFELLRNQNQNREEQLLTDCEWQLREMQKNCKDKIDKAEYSKSEALIKVSEIETKIKQQMQDLKHIKTLRAEVNSLRGLTHEQCQTIETMSDQIEELRAQLADANEELENQIEEVRKIKLHCQNTLDYKDREMIQKIDAARREVAELWEDKLITEMTRLTNELETVHVEERLDDMHKLNSENLEELMALTTRYTANEEEFRKEIEDLKEKLRIKTEQYHELRDKADSAIWETRMTLDRADRDFQLAMNREEEKKETLSEKLRKEFNIEKQEMEAKYQERLSEIKKEYEKKLSNATTEIAERHKQQLEKQWEQLVAEKEEALSAMESRHRIRMAEQEDKVRSLEVQHQRDLKDLKNAFDLDKQSLETRDMHNSQEIEQLHYKCRCLTNLFEEMRLRYERREPRAEDLREISELRSRCESQERDLDALTQRLREMQIQMEEMKEQEVGRLNEKTSRRGKQIRKPPPKTIPTSCDVIYEEEEREISPPANNSLAEENDDNQNSFEI